MNSLWDILSVAIGISFIFMILSILNSWIQDYIATVFNIRANNLADIMQNLLEPGALKLNGLERAKAPPENVVYKLQDNDDLANIAKYFKVPIADLRSANFQILGDLPFQKETVLTIPKVSYTVQVSETIDNIAEYFHVKSEDLQAANPKLSFDDLALSPKTVLTIPEGSFTVQDKDASKGIAETIMQSIGKSQKQSANVPSEESLQTTMNKIAQHLRIPINVLRKANPEVQPESQLQNGTVLKFPKVSYPVEDNETMKSIAKKFGTTIEALREANPDFFHDLPLLPDTVLTIPEISYKAKANETMNTVATNHRRPVNNLGGANPKVLEGFDEMQLPVNTKLRVPNPKAGRYTVQSNKETLSVIAKKFGVAVSDLKKANRDVRFSELQQIPEGTSLRIPKLKIGQMKSRQNLKLQLIANPVGTLYSHPIIHSLSKPGALPDRIPSKDFTAALLDFLDNIGKGDGEPDEKDNIDMDDIIKGIKDLEKKGEDEDTHPLAFRLRSLLRTAQINTQIKQINTQIDATQKAVEADIDEFQKAVSEWFDDTIVRGSLWYKRRMQRIGIICGFILAVLLNADTVGLSNALWHNAMLREAVTQAAQTSADLGQPTGEQAREQLESLTNLGLPIGWAFNVDTDDPRALPSTPGGWAGKVFGLVLTGFAISQGSQIWFDLMNRLLNLRSAGVPSNAEEPREKEKK